jgi:hypothetical protein
MDHLPQRSPESLIRMRDEMRKSRFKPTNLREQVNEETVRLWRTPKADDPNHGPASEAVIMKRIMKKQTIRFQDQVNHPGLFRTPDAGCARGAQSKERFAESMEQGKLLTLNDQVAHLLPTPRATDADHGGPNQRDSKGKPGLAMAVSMLPTPTVNGNHNRKGASPKAADGLGTFVKLYPTPTANDAKNNNAPSQRTENGRNSDALNVAAGGSLNPAWVEWLMGFPIGWTDIGTPSLTSPE